MKGFHGETEGKKLRDALRGENSLNALTAAVYFLSIVNHTRAMCIEKGTTIHTADIFITLEKFFSPVYMISQLCRLQKKWDDLHTYYDNLPAGGSKAPCSNTKVMLKR